MAVTPASSTLRVSWWTRNVYRHVCPKAMLAMGWLGRAPSIQKRSLSLDEWYAGVYALPIVWCDVYVGSQQFAQSGRLWLSPPTEEVWCPKHVGQYPPTMATIAAASGTKGPGWYPLSEREERLFTNRSNRPGDDMKDELRTDGDPICVAYLEYCTEPAMAATPASSTLRVSWWTRNVYWHVCPSSRGRTSHIAAVHLWSARCIQEEEKEAEASRRWYCYCVTTHCIGLWLFPAEDVVRAGDCSLLWEPELVSPCFTFYSIGQGRVVFLVFWCCFGVLFGLVCFGFHCPWPFLLIPLSNNDNTSTAQWLPQL